jgi:hypothetical protein
MDDATRRALQTDHLCDIVTTGRTSGEPQTSEIWFHRVGEKFYITGTPGPRGWLANMITNPEFTFRLKESVNVDLPARATHITDPAERCRILSEISLTEPWYARELGSIEPMIARGPLVEVVFLDN